MNSTIELAEGPGQTACLKLGGTLNFTTVPELNRRGQPYLGQYRQLEIDLSAVTYVNSAGLALLLDWKRLAATHNSEVRISVPPKKLLDIARLSELENILF